MLFLAVSLGSCAAASPKPSYSLSYDASSPLAVFGVEEIRQAAKKLGYEEKSTGGDYEVNLAPLDSTLGEQSYTLGLEKSSIVLKGGDERGLFYGALQLAEEMEIQGGFAGIKEQKGSPSVKLRGVRLTPSMDLRTPSYAEASTSNQLNLKNTWDLDFWEAEFTALARMRFNAVLMTTIDPWPNMVVVPGYENCAIDDVWQSKTPLDDTANGTASNYLDNSRLQPGSYEIVKKMTIQEKIAFWQKVMALANEHGIDFDFSSQNVYLYGETYDSTKPAFWSDPSPFAAASQDYGLSNALDNETTKDYIRKAVKQLCLTYPLPHQINPTAGENMEYQGTDEGYNEKWLAATYGEGYKDAYAVNPKLTVSLALGLHRTNFDDLNKAWEEFPYGYEIADKYSNVHMYGTTHPTYVNEAEKAIREEYAATGKLHPMSVAIRNEDAFHYVWGDPDWVREYLGNLPKGDVLRGFYLCTTGYCLMRDYSHVDSELNGGLYIDRHWLNFTLFGRLGYQGDLSDERIHGLIHHHFSSLDATMVEHAIAAIEAAAKILPAMGKQYCETGTDRSWYPEMCWSHPLMYGFVQAKRFMTATNAQQDSNTLSIAEYCLALGKGDTTFSLTTPSDTAKSLEDASDKALSEVAALPEELPNTTREEKEFREAVLDQVSFAYLGRYYAAKLKGSVALRLYNDGNCLDAAKKEEAVASFKAAQTAWGLYADHFAPRYVVERSTRVGVMDPVGLKENVANEVSRAEKWTYRTL